MAEALYKLDFDCGRAGSLQGLFIADKEDVKILVEKELEVYFGEVLGKHSEVYGPVSSGEVEFVSDNPEVLKVIRDYKLEHGYNPFDEICTNPDEDLVPGENLSDLTIREIVYKIRNLIN